MKVIFFSGATLALIAGLILIALSTDVAIAVLVAAATLGLLGLGAQAEDNHRELAELLQRLPPTQ